MDTVLSQPNRAFIVFSHHPDTIHLQLKLYGVFFTARSAQNYVEKLESNNREFQSFGYAEYPILEEW